ncbi:SRPBCC family protein [Flavobacterium silvaticum]|uniref:DUF2892 domain-containing protein n=1 Tax=Flavobacterium silvaticum TaxID=1852020 RepID=A0A972FYW9_9FLAO|nr:SRPBCC family protein [Flavobacterium silvaticum]NMH27366.1 DUF2892 domain-containing protein [Flavobacterium silvaticum]
MKATKTNDTRNFSRIDPSGTDPNRYASTVKPESEPAQKPFNLKVNISTVERVAMIAAGGYLLYKALSSKKKSIPKAIAGGAMLVRGAGGYCPMYDAMDNNPKLSGKNINIDSNFTVHKPAMEVYRNWRDLKNLPEFIKHLSEVREINRIESEWTANGPAGIGKITWKAHILMDEPGKVLSWQSLPGASVYNTGKVTFTEIDAENTEVRVNLSYKAPMGIAGETAANWLNPLIEKGITNDVQNFLSQIENSKPELSN